MTVIPLRPNTKQPSPEQRLRRRVFARLESNIFSYGCSLTIEGIARCYHPGPPQEIVQLVPQLRDKSPVETLSTLLLQEPLWWQIEAPDGTMLTAADLDPIVAEWIVRFEAKQKRQKERLGAWWNALNTLSESQKDKFNERERASVQRIWRVLYEHGAIRQRIINAAPSTVRHMRDRVERQLVALLRTETSLDLAMIQGIGINLSWKVHKGLYSPEPFPPEPQSPAKLRGDKEAEAAARRWVKSVDYERAIWGKRATKTGQIIGFSRP